HRWTPGSAPLTTDRDYPAPRAWSAGDRYRHLYRHGRVLDHKVRDSALRSILCRPQSCRCRSVDSFRRSVALGPFPPAVGPHGAAACYLFSPVADRVPRLYRAGRIPPERWLAIEISADIFRPLRRLGKHSGGAGSLGGPDILRTFPWRWPLCRTHRGAK